MAEFSFGLGWYRFTVPDSTYEEMEALIGGDWMDSDTGFAGYSVCRISTRDGGGFGRLGTGNRKRPKEVHVDLSQEWIAGMSYEELQAIAKWVIHEKGGHFGRIDAFLDERNGTLSPGLFHDAIKAGRCVTHFKQARMVGGFDIQTGVDGGQTLYLGSRNSATMVRVYDKREEQRAKGKVIDGPWCRIELEWKDERANAVAMGICVMSEEQFRNWLIGNLRTTMDFRQCSRDDESWDKVRAPLLDWWAKATEGMKRAKLLVEKVKRHIEDVKSWVAESLTPTLAMLCCHPEAGETWLMEAIKAGCDRWKTKHLLMLKERRGRMKLYKLQPV